MELLDEIGLYDAKWKRMCDLLEAHGNANGGFGRLFISTPLDDSLGSWAYRQRIAFGANKSFSEKNWLRYSKRKERLEEIGLLIPNQNILLLGFVRVRELEMVRVSEMVEDDASRIDDAVHRDMARIQSLEQDSPTRYNCFAVNLTIPSPYTGTAHRHLLADFSRPKFVKDICKAFGNKSYSQVYFDHVWFQDSHAKDRWKPALFSTVLPELSTCLDCKPGSDIPTAVIYLPCCSHTIINVHANREKIIALYEVTGLTREQIMAEAPAYQVTQTLSDSGMLQQLGKIPDQSRYSGYRKQDLMQCVPTGMGGQELIEEADKLYSNDTIMIRLRLLTDKERKHRH